MADQPSDSDVARQREKLNEYRRWMQQQQSAIESTGAATAAMARRLEAERVLPPHPAAAAAAAVSASSESAYMRRNLRRQSPTGGVSGGGASSSGAGGGRHSPTRQLHSDGMSSPPQGGAGGAGSPRSSERPKWINTKVNTTNMKAVVPAEQLAKFTPPPPVDDGGYRSDPLNVFSRSQLWQKRKHQKLYEARELKEQVMDMECTFAPVTRNADFISVSSSRERSRDSGAARGGRGGDDDEEETEEEAQRRAAHGGFRVTGVDEFLNRQQRARAEAQFREARLRTQPQFQWKNETTVPDPFDLGRRRTHRIKSLRQPFTAAPGAVASAMRGVAPAGNVFGALESVLPRGAFSGITAQEIVDCAVLREGGSPAAMRR